MRQWQGPERPSKSSGVRWLPRQRGASAGRRRDGELGSRFRIERRCLWRCDVWMLAHGGVVVKRANETRFCTVVRAQMVVIGHRLWKRKKRPHAVLAQNHGIVCPLAAFFRPRLAAKGLFESALSKRVVKWLQARTHL